MKVTPTALLNILSPLRAYFQRNNIAQGYGSDQPLRSELFNSYQMNEHGKAIASKHQLLEKKSPDQLLKRLQSNDAILLEVRNVLVESIRLGKPISPGAEWLLDNFYLIEEQVVLARKHLPKGYSEGLPTLADGISAGFPRVYDIVLEIISHSDGRVDAASLTSFIAAYQTRTILTLGELWAIPIMLRLAVIENLRRVCGKIALDMIDHNLADYWAERMIATIKENPGDMILEIADMARSEPVLVSPFVAGFARALQGKGPAFALPLNWMEQQLSSLGTTINDLVQQENRKQAADQVSVSNSIGTLRFIGATDWREFVETLSSVEKVLRQDITGIYPLMDFSTRDRYRHVIENISKSGALSETEVAVKVLELAGKGEESGNKFTRHQHLGYYLIDKGLVETERITGRKFTLWQILMRTVRSMPVFIYLTSILLLTLLFAVGMCHPAYNYHITYSGWVKVLLAIVSILAATQLAVSLVNWLATMWVKPTLLPRMNFSKGIPSDYRTLIVIPSMLTGKTSIEELTEALEIRYLANKDANLHFGLLTDFIDASQETLPEDQSFVEHAKNGIEVLNQKYKRNEEDIFFLFHRPRTWNESERKWMGYERKRGKLSALNALLRSKSKNDFSLIVGNYTILTSVKYVITLDSDTQLPRDAACKFIATMAHPLNQAVYNKEKRRVTDGYGILQPRVASAMPPHTTLYLRMQGDVSGIDPYTRVSSDVYQDIFGEGSFIGKGIYDVDVFEEALDQVFPENRILSHDLLEGCYVRSGLLSDILLYEDNPAQYSVDIKRHHRWIRGDWQIGAWMLPFVTNKSGRLVKNKLTILSRWKIFDNLRRSLLPLSLTLLLLLGWTILPFPWFWTLTVTLIVLLPVMIAAGWQLIHKPVDLTLNAHFLEVGTTIRDFIIRFIFDMAVLPYQALLYADAILKTNWRMVISKRKLLEWTPSATAARLSSNNILRVYRYMYITPILAAICMSLLLYNNLPSFLVASPILILWMLAPALVWRLSLTEREKDISLPEAQLQLLHRSARKTWAYFEQFVTATDNWLPPDNYQEEPIAVLAHRTSPTNMGLSLLANLTAYDFGYISTSRLIRRTLDTLQNMEQLERYKGHFYNWNDTISMQPLNPRYVSTVDSGNLAGQLLTFRQGLFLLPSKPILNSNIYQGLITTATIVKDTLQEVNKVHIDKIINHLQLAASEPFTIRNTKKHLTGLTNLADQLPVSELEDDIATKDWIRRFREQLTDVSTDMEAVIPWIELLPVPEKFHHLVIVAQNLSLSDIRDMPDHSRQYIDDYETEDNSAEENEWLQQLRIAILKGSVIATEYIAQLEHMAVQCEQLSDYEYAFLFDKTTSLLSIGYNVDEQRKDDSFYDLLASEARFGIFVAIAQGKIPQESWFALGRLLTNSGGDPILLSWSGSMFEYLMPQLVMPSYENTLLYQTNKATVKRQIEYANQRGIPWGISESAYNMVDANLNYQYRAFGVPGLGLKRGLEEDLVIAPYATMLALMIAPVQASANLEVLAARGFEGSYGFYEAIDFTPSRLPRDKEFSIISSYMVHHQAMGLLSLSYLLLNKPMQHRFTSDLRFQATLLLLQERIPRTTLFYAHTADIIETHASTEGTEVRAVSTPYTTVPEIQLLSNGRYQVMVTNSGGGYSRWNEQAVTRWREDTTKDDRGIFCYIKDVNSGNFWSNTHQPTLNSANGYEVVFSQGHVEFHRHDHGIDTKTEIVVSPEDDVELRRVKLTNRTSSVKVLEVTSYAEVVMANQASDESHPAFSNLFVQTEIIQQHQAIFCTRRARSEEEVPPWMFHLMQIHGTTQQAISFETDRMRFIGRGKTLAHPQAIDEAQLSGSDGAVLDPIVAIRYRITIPPGHTATVDMIFGAGATRGNCENLIYKYRDQHLKKRALELSWTHSQVFLRQINTSEADAQIYNRLAASLIYANPTHRATESVIMSNFRGQSGLWGNSVSGDLPIVLLYVYDPENIEMVRQLVHAHAYWRLKGLAVDLVIWNEDYSSYRQLMHEQIMGIVTSGVGELILANKKQSVFVRSADQVSAEDRVLFESVARVIIHDNNGTLAEQVNRHYIEKALPPLFEPTHTIEETPTEQAIRLPDDLLFNNGTGGFTPDGKEYKIITDKKQSTPAPWVNVIANTNFGTVISESGAAYTWAVNAHEYRITPWDNDPVSNVAGEAFYLRDEDIGHFWSPSPFPSGGESPYIITHGFGYSSYVHVEQGLTSEMSVFVDKDQPIKFVVLKINNNSGRNRKISATGFLEIILGDVRAKTNMHILSEFDALTNTLLLRNRYNTPFAERVSFFKIDSNDQISFTTDRAEFIGRNQSISKPQALSRKRLSGKSGAGMDPCAALQVKFEIFDGAEKEIIFQIGSEANKDAIDTLISKFQNKEQVKESLQQVKDYWAHTLGAVQVKTPDMALNIMANGWLLYQTLACRIYARSGFYQSGGAFGFRDQLQDVLALLHTRPEIAKEQILLCASRQFTDGDVQHWWHPPEGRGVRTNCSDDLLWLPFAVSRYIEATGDKDILLKQVGFLECRQLNDNEDSLYDLPISGHQRGTLYEHCLRSIKHSLQFGKHGLPLMGSGDWNDGMDQVGNKGQGESVWLAFFFYDILQKFTDTAKGFGDDAFSRICDTAATLLRTNIEASGWDGEWYLRAYFDNGSPLGSKENKECRIDAIAQSWSVLSGAASSERADIAMASLDKYLVKKDLKIIQLLDPPFDGEGINPGYIKGYVPGVRENGGQYSHAAIWALMAFANIGNREKVWELFDMVKPLGHAADATAIQVYKVEPYVMAADVYANESHKGRGGWTWYTGSSGWMYQFITGSLLGMELLDGHLKFNPCFPADWPSVFIMYHYGLSTYHITVFQEKESIESWCIVNGMRNEGNIISLIDDSNNHTVEVYIAMDK